MLVSAEKRGDLSVAVATATQVQVFGSKKSADTRKALRFFSERRVRTHFVDFAERGPSPGELRRFIDKFGVEALIDREGRRFQELGLHHATRGNEWWTRALVDDPLLLRMPLVRCGSRLTIGLADEEWRIWLSL